MSIPHQLAIQRKKCNFAIWSQVARYKSQEMKLQLIVVAAAR
jgi:hypothetical protein